MDLLEENFFLKSVFGKPIANEDLSCRKNLAMDLQMADFSLEITISRPTGPAKIVGAPVGIGRDK